MFSMFFSVFFNVIFKDLYFVASFISSMFCLSMFCHRPYLFTSMITQEKLLSDLIKLSFSCSIVALIAMCQ